MIFDTLGGRVGVVQVSTVTPLMARRKIARESGEIVRISITLGQGFTIPPLLYFNHGIGLQRHILH
jgi:hypothetical protein